MLLRWSQDDLATAAGVARSTVADWERGVRQPVPNNLRALQTALETAGIRFLNEGDGGLVLHRQAAAPPDQPSE